MKKNGTDVDVRIFISQARKDHSEFVSIKVGLGYELRTMEFTKEDTKIVVDSDIYVGRVLENIFVIFFILIICEHFVIYNHIFNKIF